MTTSANLIKAVEQKKKIVKKLSEQLSITQKFAGDLAQHMDKMKESGLALQHMSGTINDVGDFFGEVTFVSFEDDKAKLSKALKSINALELESEKINVDSYSDSNDEISKIKEEVKSLKDMVTNLILLLETDNKSPNVKKKKDTLKPSKEITEKIKNLIEYRDGEIKRKKIAPQKLKACQGIPIDPKTVEKYAPELWKNWKITTYQWDGKLGN